MLQKISRHRQSIMGVAILWILLHHSGLNLSGPLFAIKRSGFGGVEMFLFVSGFGCAISLMKNGDIPQFYGRRFRRLYPHYIPVMLAFLLMNLSGAGVLEWTRTVLGNLTGFTYWANVGLNFNWYIFGILAFYIMTPLFLEVLKKKGGWAVLLGLSFAAGFCFAGTDLRTCVSRLPIYVMGMMAGMRYKKDQEEEKTAAWKYACVFAVGVLGMVMLLGMYRFQDRIPEDLYIVFYPCILTTPAILTVCCLLFDALEKSAAGKWVNKFFSFLGSISLDLYLLHIVLYGRVGEWLEGQYDNTIPMAFSAKNLAIWLGVLAATIVVSKGYSLAVDWCMKKMSARKQA